MPSLKAHLSFLTKLWSRDVTSESHGKHDKITSASGFAGAHPFFTDDAKGDDVQLEAQTVPLFQGRNCMMLAVGPTHCLAVFEDQT